jgi:hypothetical protein
VVHPSHNDEGLHWASRHGQYFLTHLGLIDFMKRFKLSFATNSEMDFADLWEYTGQSLQDTLDNLPTDGDRWRVVVHENDSSAELMARAGYMRLQAMRSYGVRIDFNTSVEEPFLCALKSTQGPTIFNSKASAELVATGLLAIGYESHWSKTLATMFKDPSLQIQRAIEDEWTNVTEFKFLSTRHKMVFNNDFTNTSIVTAE